LRDLKFERRQASLEAAHTIERLRWRRRAVDQQTVGLQQPTHVRLVFAIERLSDGAPTETL
jgi:hypothetical protein